MKVMMTNTAKGLLRKETHQAYGENSL
jgi:hypothetical protein